MWNYTGKVMDHFLNPRNVGVIENPDAEAEVGNMSCGDALKLYLKLDETGRITDAKFQTFGCASAIASSSALTEIVKGMTLDEAAKVTNRDIASLLGELPEEKMHCSVMGMEALQSAIADYNRKHGIGDSGIVADTSHDDHEGRIVCRCFGVTDAKIRKVAKDNQLHSVEEITAYTKAGGACGTCLDQIQEILDELWHTGHQEQPEPAVSQFDTLSPVKKVMMIQDVIDKEIKPILERDGGGIEFMDLEGNVVKVKLQGMCASCRNAKITLQNLVQKKLNEFLSNQLIVEEV